MIIPGLPAVSGVLMLLGSQPTPTSSNSPNSPPAPAITPPPSRRSSTSDASCGACPTVTSTVTLPNKNLQCVPMQCAKFKRFACPRVTTTMTVPSSCTKISTVHKTVTQECNECNHCSAKTVTATAACTMPSTTTTKRTSSATTTTAAVSGVAKDKGKRP